LSPGLSARREKSRKERWKRKTKETSRRLGTSRGFGHLSNLKFKSFENATERREMILGGKQIFTISLIHAEERLIDVVHRRALSFL